MTGHRQGSVAALAGATRLAERIAERTGGRVRLDGAAVLDRSDSLALRPPGEISPNGSCRLIRAADGWIAANLPREDDIELVPAWAGCDFAQAGWAALERAAAAEQAADFVVRGAELGLAVARLEETLPLPGPGMHQIGEPAPRGPRLRVLDLSALWAGPLCGAILAEAGHEVLKAESPSRPDPVARSTPAHDARLNGEKRRASVAFTRAGLLPLLAEADVVLTSARPRAFAALGLGPEDLLPKRPGLIWVAITGHGWHGPGAGRTGFGDDAAVAGGLVNWDGDAPRFAGDALADPLTGLAAGLAALEAIAAGGGVLIDAAMASTAARVAVGE